MIVKSLLPMPIDLDGVITTSRDSGKPIVGNSHRKVGDIDDVKLKLQKQYHQEKLQERFDRDKTSNKHLKLLKQQSKTLNKRSQPIVATPSCKEAIDDVALNGSNVNLFSMDKKKIHTRSNLFSSEGDSAVLERVQFVPVTKLQNQTNHQLHKQCRGDRRVNKISTSDSCTKEPSYSVPLVRKEISHNDVLPQSRTTGTQLVQTTIVSDKKSTTLTTEHNQRKKKPNPNQLKNHSFQNEQRLAAATEFKCHDVDDNKDQIDITDPLPRVISIGCDSLGSNQNSLITNTTYERLRQKQRSLVMKQQRAVNSAFENKDVYHNDLLLDAKTNRKKNHDVEYFNFGGNEKIISKTEDLQNRLGCIGMDGSLHESLPKSKKGRKAFTGLSSTTTTAGCSPDFGMYLKRFQEDIVDNLSKTVSNKEGDSLRDDGTKVVTDFLQSLVVTNCVSDTPIRFYKPKSNSCQTPTTIELDTITCSSSISNKNSLDETYNEAMARNIEKIGITSGSSRRITTAHQYDDYCYENYTDSQHQIRRLGSWDTYGSDCVAGGRSVDIDGENESTGSGGSRTYGSSIYTPLKHHSRDHKQLHPVPINGVGRNDTIKSCKSTINYQPKQRVVQFQYPPISSVRQCPRIDPEEIPTLFYSEEELDMFEEDRKSTFAADDVEIVAISSVNSVSSSAMGDDDDYRDFPSTVDGDILSVKPQEILDASQTITPKPTTNCQTKQDVSHLEDSRVVPKKVTTGSTEKNATSGTRVNSIPSNNHSKIPTNRPPAPTTSNESKNGFLSWKCMSSFRMNQTKGQGLSCKALNYKENKVPPTNNDRASDCAVDSLDVERRKINSLTSTKIQSADLPLSTSTPSVVCTSDSKSISMDEAKINTTNTVKSVENNQPKTVRKKKTRKKRLVKSVQIYLRERSVQKQVMDADETI